jgi:hypothetical protein
MLRLFATSLLVSIAVSAGGTQVHAQQPGDVYWQLVPNGIVADERIQYALLLLIESDTVAVGAGLDGSLLYGNPEHAEFSAQVEQPQAEAELLFAAAGFDEPSQQLTEVRHCRFWVPPDAEESSKVLNQVGLALGEALAAAWATVGVEIQPCEVTANRDDADLLVWGSGEDYAIPQGVYNLDADSYVATEVERPGAVPGGSGGGDVSPPTTGDAGLR